MLAFIGIAANIIIFADFLHYYYRHHETKNSQKIFGEIDFSNIEN
jgi:hypothetical protein